MSGHFLQQEFEVAGVARDGRTLVDMAKCHKPDVVVTGISLPHLSGIDAARIVRKDVPGTRILFLTMHPDPLFVEEAFRAGASGFVLKVSGAEELVKAIQAVAKGETYISPLLAGDVISALLSAGPQEMSGETALTMGQRRVLQLLAEGKTMTEAAALMRISTRDAESHKSEVMRKLGVQTIAGLLRSAVNIKPV